MTHDNETDQTAVINPRAVIGGNRPPPEPIAQLALAPEDKRIADSVENADKWIAEYPVIEDEDVGKVAADHLEQLEKDLKACEEKFKAEKAPHDAKLAEIRAQFHPRLARYEICLKAIRPRFRAWIKLKEDRRKASEAEAARVAAEAQRRADQLAEQAKAGGPNAIAQAIVALEATQEAERAHQAAAAVPKRTQIRGALGGRTHSLRTEWQVRIHEIDKTFAHYKGRREVFELLQRLANADARNPRLWPDPEVRYIPGCHTWSEQV